MKITFSNLGAIKKTTLDLRPLTVIIGPNNSNKTYIAYSIYGLSDLSVNLLGQNLKFKVLNDSKFLIKIDKAFYGLIQKVIKARVEELIENLGVFFQDSSQKIFDRTSLELKFSLKELIKSVQNLIERGHPFNDRFKFEFDGENLIFETISENEKDNKVSDNLSDAVRSSLFSLSQQWNATAVINAAINSLVSKNSLLLPAERNAFIITYKMLANRRYKFLRDAQRNVFGRKTDERQLELLKESGDLNYPQPIEDFLDFLTDIELEINTKDESNLERNEFYEIADGIEETIQGKNKTNFMPTKLGGKEIKINVKKGLDIDLYNASSSIKQLAPLLLYLRYRAQENDLLIIDEPEMNLHPESQAKLLEVLGMLVNAGVNVLLTTHSPYFMSHLNNLIAGDMIDEKTREKQAKSLYLEDARAFLKPEDVSAYEMRQNKAGNQTLHDLHDKDYGIRWDTLSDVSADIQQKYFEIYEKSKQSSDGKEEN